MIRLRISTPSRLHFGLLAWGPGAPRQFGGVGLMIERPGLEMTAEPASRWEANGPLGKRIIEVARGVSAKLVRSGSTVEPLRFHAVRMPGEHVGLGTGTQLSLAVARLVTQFAGVTNLSAAGLAELVGRGRRSGIGIHGFQNGGLIVDGGRGGDGGTPPLLIHLPFPNDWWILVLIPSPSTGWHGDREARAFQDLSPLPQGTTDRLCCLLLLELLPAVVERDLKSFGSALREIQGHVGKGFAAAQGGLFADPSLEAIADALTAEGLHGVGQSSWGPALYAFSRDEEERRKGILSSIRERFALSAEAAFWTRAASSGAVVSTESIEP